MVKKKEQLFQLIKSLTKEEKRHFKLYVNKYSSARENNYLKLFNVIDKQDVYDETSIKKQFAGETFIKQLTVTKHYLQKQIIRSLQNLHYDDTIDLSMLALHHQIAVLYKKGHYEMCRELVKKGIETSSKNEMFLEWIGFLKWELDLINKMDITEYKNSLNNYLEKTSHLLSLYEINTKGNHLTNQLQIFALDAQAFGSHNTQYHRLIKKIKDLILTTDFESLPLKTRFNLYFPLAQSYFAIFDYKTAFDYFLMTFKELENEYKSKQLYEQYINTLIGLIYASSAINRTDIVKKAFKELKLVPEVNHHISFRKAESLAFYPLINCAINGDFYNGVTAIEIIESFLKTHSEKVTPIQYIFAYYYAAYIYAGNGNNTLALKYLRKTDAYQNKDLLPNLRLGIKIMEITIFYDQRKYDLIESRLRSLQRQLHKEDSAKAFLKKYSKYFQKLIIHEPDSKEATELHKRFHKDLKQMALQDQISLFIIFDMISWVESKIDKCTLGEKMQMNAAKLFAATSQGNAAALPEQTI
jgi:hypothetical protein